ncbi:MAG: DM13 domain-containing protein [Acidimicrobiia bacterium]
MRNWVIGLGLVVAVVGFLAFRPDKLFLDDPVDEGLSEAFAEEEPPPETTGAPGTTVVPGTTTAAEPEAVLRGSWRGIDHTASGTVTVYRQSDRYALRFEDDTDIQNGPDLKVWFLEGSDYQGGQPTTFLNLGPLKGNVGGQNYELDADFDPARHRAVLVWCERFSVPFAVAPLTEG